MKKREVVGMQLNTVQQTATCRAASRGAACPTTRGAGRLTGTASAATATTRELSLLKIGRTPHRRG
jgi:hypothetical protein